MLIAEIGFNFLGNLDLCNKMILSAKENGADAVKFQIWNPNYLIKGDWDKDGRREIYEKAYLTEEKYNKILNYSREIYIECFASVPTIRDAKFLKGISDNIVKIPSMEAYNHKLIEYCLTNFSKVFLSTGAMTEKELKSIISYKNEKNLFVFHCVSSYPLKLENFNYGKFLFLKKNFKNFGYSGHFDGIDDAIFAIANGAKLIEKHFTIDKNLPGRDNKFALLPNQFNQIKKFIISNNKINQKNSLNLLDEEYEVYKNYRGRWG